MAGARPANSSAGKKVLLVDDDTALRESLSEQLQLHEEFTTVEAETGGQALEIAKSPSEKFLI